MMNNFRKVIAVVIAFTMISGALLVIIPSAGQSAEAKTLANPEQFAMYADPSFRDLGLKDLAKPDLSSNMAIESKMLNNTPIGTVQPFVTSATFWDDTGAPFTDEANATWYDAYNVINMTKRGEGLHCEMWVANDLSFYNLSDPRAGMVNIENWMVDYMIDEFDTTIYPIMTETFIDAPQINGSNANVTSWQYLLDNDTKTLDNLTDEGWIYKTNDTGKVMIMVFNIIDESWYDGDTYGSYIAGYYSPSMRNLYDRNIMHIDCYDWANRINDPYIYESTFAHEYQHLLQDEQDPNEDTWVNEGLSMAAEFLCGYGIPFYPYVTYYFLCPDNSLTVWGDLPGDLILGDYGAVLLFMLYIYDHYGGKPMLQSVFFNDLNGIESIDDAMLDMGHNRITFDKVFRDWRLANLMLDNDVGGGLYSYKSFDRSDLLYLENVWIYEYSWSTSPKYHSDFGTLEYIQAYGVDYIVLYDPDSEDASLRDSDRQYLKFVFDGDDQINAGWQYEEDVNEFTTILETIEPEPYTTWWNSNNGDQINNLLTTEVNLTNSTEDGEHLMTVTSRWYIEEGWDFGFVQVSTDGGLTWTSLDDEENFCTNVTDPGVMPSIEDNLPGITGKKTWTNMTFDLSAYDGMEVLVGFRYMTDWASSYDGWDIAAVKVDGESVDLTSMKTDVAPETDFLVTIVALTYDENVMIIDVPCLDADETAKKLFAAGGYEAILVLVSPTLGPVDYSVDVTYRGQNMPV